VVGTGGHGLGVVVPGTTSTMIAFITYLEYSLFVHEHHTFDIQVLYRHSKCLVRHILIVTTGSPTKISTVPMKRQYRGAGAVQNF
jgi:hypothetical protein